MSRYLKKQKVIFAGGVLIIALTAIILFNPIFGKINHLPDKLLAKLSLQSIAKFASEKFSALSAEAPLFFFPHFPQRLTYVASEISAVSEELVVLNKELVTLTEECDCKFAESQCVQGAQTEIIGSGISCEPGLVKVFGEPCPRKKGGTDETESTIEETQSDIHDLTIHLSFLQELLKKERESGLEEQLQTLRKDDADALRNNLTNLLQFSQDIAEPVGENLNLPDKCLVDNCTPKCEAEATLGINACFNPGEQKPIEAKFSAGVSLEDLNLGKVGIKRIKLNLPEKIQVPALPKLPSLTITIPDITLTCPTERQTITFHSPSPLLPPSPTLTLSCPEFSDQQSYECSVSPEEENKTSIETKWYFETFSWLSEKCLVAAQKGKDLNDLEDYESSIQNCLKPEGVSLSQTTINECDRLWYKYDHDCILWHCHLKKNKPPDICWQIGRPSERTSKAIEWCNTLFSEEGQTPPAACSSEPEETTKQKCDEIKSAEREEPPLSCKLLPLFTGKLENPDAETILGKEKTCQAQTIADYPNPVPGCSLAFPSVPKISFPKVIIPDIHLPSFSFPPLFNVKLPNFIFEDLILPDLDLCDLDECQFQFPYLSFKVPSLKIPQIEVPPVQLNIPGAPQIEVGVAPIQFRPLQLQMPQLFNLSNLMTPELEMPNISLPKPEIDFAFKGLNADLLSILLGLFKVPTGGCWSTDLVKFTPLSIIFPDYIFSWPAFPEVPPVEKCEDIRKFCRETKSDIQGFQDKALQIQNKVNAKFQSEIQDKLDKLAEGIQEKIESEIQAQLNDISQKIEDKIKDHIAPYTLEYTLPPEAIAPMPGVLPVGGGLPCNKIPPLTIEGVEIENIEITAIDLSELWETKTGEPFPTEISIDWPDELKEIPVGTGSGARCDNDADCPNDGEVCYETKKCLKPLEYELPTIPLSKLSYSKKKPQMRTIKLKNGENITITQTGKDITVRLPGFQRSMPSVDFDLLFKPVACVSKPPDGGNPCPTVEIQSNLDKIKRIREQVGEASQNIIDILE